MTPDSTSYPPAIVRSRWLSLVPLLWTGCLAVPLAGCLAPPEVEPLPIVEDPALLHAPHGEVGGFFLPWLPQSDRGFGALRWALTRNAFRGAPEPRVPVVANDGGVLRAPLASAKITWVGHATFAVRDEDDVFLTDPHFGDRALVVGRHTPPGIPLESVPDDAFAVLSHNHYDHLDAWTVEHLPEGVAWYVPLGMADWFRDRGVADVVELDWWESARRGRFTITCLPSQHWSRRIEQGMNEALWCAWLIDSGKRRYFFAGDTGYFHGFAEYGRRFAPIDVAMLPIGAYEPRWFMQEAHMNPAEAWQAFLDLGARHLLPMHWGTFDLTDEPIDEAPRELARVLEREGGDPARVRLLAIGETWTLPEDPGPHASASPE
jgi:N-acyl-phosphatidylethanolamine-hydrolysing phospholipase D